MTMTKEQKVAKGATAEAVAMALHIIDRYADVGDDLDWDNDVAVAGVLAGLYNLGAGLVVHMKDSDQATKEDMKAGRLCMDRANEIIGLLKLMDAKLCEDDDE